MRTSHHKNAVDAAPLLVEVGGHRLSPHSLMQVKRVIDPNKRLVITTVTGEITMPEVRADMAQLSANTGYDSNLPGLVDMRNATTKLTADELMEMAETIKHSPKAVGKARRAMLVGSELMYGLFRMYVSFASGSVTEYRIFRDEAAARAWLEEPASEESAESNPGPG